MPAEKALCKFIIIIIIIIIIRLLLFLLFVLLLLHFFTYTVPVKLVHSRKPQSCSLNCYVFKLIQ